MEKHDYAMQDKAALNDLDVGDSLIESSDEWVLESVNPDKLVYSHTDGVEIHIVQTGVVGAGLPFEVVRQTSTSDQYRVDESDWFRDALSVARAYALGYVEANE